MAGTMLVCASSPDSGEVMSIETKSRMKRHNIGEVSSKYGLRPDLFEADVQAHAEEAEREWQDFKAWMMERQITPERLRSLFVRLYEEFLAP